jgi:hypothetical protein
VEFSLLLLLLLLGGFLRCISKNRVMLHSRSSTNPRSIVHRKLSSALGHRLHKVEHVHIKPAQGGIGLYQGLAAYFNFYNHQRPHQSLKYEAPVVRFERLKSVA